MAINNKPKKIARVGKGVETLEVSQLADWGVKWLSYAE